MYILKSQLISLNSTLNQPGLIDSVSAVIAGAKQPTRRLTRKYTPNNILLDSSTTSSTNNLSDFNSNLNDESSETSGQSKATNTMQSSSPSFSQEMSTNFGELDANEQKADSTVFTDYLKAKVSDRPNIKKTPRFENNDSDEDDKDDGRQQAEIENEINRLRKENSLLIINKSKSKPVRKPRSINTNKVTRSQINK